MVPEKGRIDVQRLIGAVAARHGVLLKPDDAAFALVTMNQIILEETMGELLEAVEQTLREFDEAAVRIQGRAGSLLADEVKGAAAAIRHDLESDIATAGKQAREFVVEVHQAHSRSAREKWLALGAASALLLFVAGIFVGRVWQ